jgi:hypothetical protein
VLARAKRETLYVFLAFFLIYLSLSPGTVMEQGYMPGNLSAATEFVGDVTGYWLRFNPAPHALVVPHNGIFELLCEVPFVFLAHIFFGPAPEWADRMLSVESVLFTALLCMLIFLWVRKITGSSRSGLFFALLAGFTTMLWAYAYINMETTQSFFLMLAAYLGLGAEHERTWLRAVVFGICCGLAISVKSAGVLLMPAIAWLVANYFRDQFAAHFKSMRYWYKTAGVAAVVAIILCITVLTKSRWTPNPDSAGVVQDSLVQPFRALLNFLSYFGSVNKGLFIYCPVMLLSFLYIKRAADRNLKVVIFAVLALGGMALGCSTFYWWSDECWGPRYLNCTVAPFVLCFALVWKAAALGRRAKIVLAILSSWGLVVSLLGALFAYHSLHAAAIYSSPATIEELQYDVTWNPIWFDFRLLRIWLRGPTAPPQPDEIWPSNLHDWGTVPQNRLDTVHSLNIRQWAMPQSFLIRTWYLWGTRADLVCWWICALALGGGCSAFGFLAVQMQRDIRREQLSRAIQDATG